MSSDDDLQTPAEPPWESTFLAQMVRLREEKKISQAELARRLRDGEGKLPFHQQTIQRIENGDRPVRLNEAFLIAKELGASIESMTWRDKYGVREIRDSVDDFQRSSATIARDLIESLERLSESSGVVDVFVRDALRWEDSGMLEATPLLNWMAYWSLRYVDIHEHLTAALESCAVAAGSKEMGVDHIDRQWSTLAPSDNVEAVDSWIDAMKIDRDHLMDIPADEVYRELELTAYEERFGISPEEREQLDALSTESVALSVEISNLTKELTDRHLQLAESADSDNQDLPKKEFDEVAERLAALNLKLRRVRAEQDRIWKASRERREGGSDGDS